MVLLLLGAAAFAGCSDSSVVSPPTAPSSLAAIPTPPPGQLVSGTVSDSALRRLSGATVELLDGPQTGASAITNAMGQFAIWGTVDDATRFRASKFLLHSIYSKTGVSNRAALVATLRSTHTPHGSVAALS